MNLTRNIFDQGLKFLLLLSQLKIKLSCKNIEINNETILLNIKKSDQIKW